MVTVNGRVFCTNFSGVDPIGGCGPPTRALFGENVRTKILRPVGGVRRIFPLDLPMNLSTIDDRGGGYSYSFKIQ